MAKQEERNKLPRDARSKEIRMSHNLVRIPQSFMKHLDWDSTGKIQVHIQRNGTLLLRQVTYCALCGEAMTPEEKSEGKNNVMPKDGAPKTYVCNECICRLK